MRADDHDQLMNDATTWRKAQADELTVIIDAAAFFFAAKQAMLKAKKSVIIVGWDFDARIKLEPEEKTLEGPNQIGSFLNWLAKHRDDVEVRILKWDAGIMESLSRGETPFYILQWMTHGRVQMKLDHAHPPLAAHHMKILAIDDTVAFCGGIDMTLGRWDTPEHEEGRKGRRSPWRNQLGPWHDATTCISGPAARMIGDLARRRWQKACDEELPPVEGGAAAWPDCLEPDFRDITVGLARTIPAYEDSPQISEIEKLKLQIIQRAKKSLYIESQYFASIAIAKAIATRLQEDDPPEIVIVNPDTAEGWLEAKVMDSARIQMMRRVLDADRHGRFRILYPVNAAGTPIYVHAKIMIADDTILKIGSANLNNRSMGYDTECDVVLEGTDEAARATIARIRNNLLAEHLGASRAEIEASLERSGGSLIAAIREFGDEPPAMKLVPMRELTDQEEALGDSDLADPERPHKLWKSLKGLVGA
ncbi:phospholipase D-like domain-containing protein [Afifella sp. IM 167]|uniref:phospholipase D-like domain-containing protein n=1 Tax=Afifella sp. IM 167 TaxID=2033586 RepID=UPI001CCD2F3F|nr:phospholipase D-like domain-containing protein [Afifella sp. IM 167]MBZ8133334.1 phospholipase [Afifella sp. IM 167]